MVRAIVGVVAGWIVWFVGFLALAIGLASVWPEYRVHGQAWMNDHVFDFPTVMAVCNVAFWVLAEIAAGWVGMAIARRREAVWALAAIVGGYLLYEHLYAEWANIPAWYNLAVAITGIPAVLLGGNLAGRRVPGSRPAAASTL
jgi:hypothetical protein